MCTLISTGNTINVMSYPQIVVRHFKLIIFKLFKAVVFLSHLLPAIAVLFFQLIGENPADCWLSDLLTLLSSVMAAKPSERANICEGN